MFLGSSLKGRSGMTTEFSRSPPEQSATESSRDVALQAELKAPRGPVCCSHCAIPKMIVRRRSKSAVRPAI